MKPTTNYGPKNLKIGTQWIDTDVLTAAKQRIRHVINAFDHIEVAFSGGKDSLVVLNLVREVYDEMGMEKVPVNCLFRDEELIPDNVIEFVQSYYHNPRFKMRYFAFPLANQRFILGASRPYIQWDPNRKWMRAKPEYAITTFGPEWDANPGIQHDVDQLSFTDHKGRVAVLNGVRAEESLTRFRSCLSKKNENYINATSAKNVKFVKPIYDWTQDDVFRYFYDRKIPYAPIYDHQMFAQSPLRVSTPLHAMAYRYLKILPNMYPTFWSQLIDIFPDVHAHFLYWKDIDIYRVIDNYPHSWEGIYQYIEDHIDPKNQEIAVKAVQVKQKTRETLEKSAHGRYDNLYGYPILYVFKIVVGAKHLKGIQPKHTRASNKEFEFEGLLPPPDEK